MLPRLHMLSMTRCWNEEDGHLDDGYVEVRVYFTGTPGTPPSGQVGPPENYDPGSAPEIEFNHATMECSPGIWVPADSATAEWAERSLASGEWSHHIDDLFADDGPDPDDARDRIAEDREFAEPFSDLDDC